MDEKLQKEIDRLKDLGLTEEELEVYMQLYYNDIRNQRVINLTKLEAKNDKPTYKICRRNS